jgi:hypothetical protein
MGMKPLPSLLLAIACAPISGSLAQEAALPSPDWGSFEAVADHPGCFEMALDAREKTTSLALPTPFPHIVKATLAGDPVTILFNEDATEISLGAPAGDAAMLRLEIAEDTAQFADGRIVFSALDAKVIGDGAKLESHPGNHRIGFWSKVEDKVKWDYKATRPGMYDLAITYSLASGLSNTGIELGEAACEVELSATGSWYRYTTVEAGRLYIPAAGKTSLMVAPISKTGGAVMNLKAIVLTPAPEGDKAVQEGDTITLDSSAATVHSTKMQYERKDVKLCLGFWINPKDWASWDFSVKEPGTYKVLFTQGCGRGQGGSAVDVLLGDQKLEFTVEDTGGFQNWKERDLGTLDIDKAGLTRLEVRPQSKAKGAVMDIRRIVLVKQ